MKAGPPHGRVQKGALPAAREVEEETGWRVETVKPLVYAQPANGITDSEHHLFRADGATYVGAPIEVNESDRIDWIPPLRDPRHDRPPRNRQQRKPRRAALPTAGRGRQGIGLKAARQTTGDLRFKSRCSLWSGET